ncbi:hypothetical protein [Acrocarpospora catenulata]|uniref:hypothetical protein n=1 Tax=Acrocarpospora catenulata TaxID=2836182 RepID=UPI001BD9F7FB|nr:hypothetical protein [Acrocarpospora catenulata]
MGDEQRTDADRQSAARKRIAKMMIRYLRSRNRDGLPPLIFNYASGLLPSRVEREALLRAELDRRQNDFQSLVEDEIEYFQEIIDMRTPESGIVPVPVVLYLDDETPAEQVREALAAVLDTLNQEIILVGHPIKGSIWQAFIAAVRRQATPERLDSTAHAARAGMQARLYGEPQSQITKATSEAVASLLDTLKDNSNALIAIGDILIVKVDGVPLVRQLTPEQVDHLQKNPRLYTDPRLALSILDGSYASVQNDTDAGQRAVSP